MESLRLPRSIPSCALKPALIIALATIAAVGSGCASGPKKEEGRGIISKALESVGLKKSPEEMATSRGKAVPLRLWAGNNLNSGNDGRSMAVVVKVYRLRDGERFERAPFSTFLNEEAERDALGDDLVSASEIVLQPGQRHEFTERLPPEARTLGVVALFRAPAQDRWRLSFDAIEAQEEGVTLGLHACALTTSSPALRSVIGGEPHSLTRARCSAP